MPNVAMLHKVDPRTELIEKFGSALDGFEILNNEVLIATYMRPETTKGGIILTPKVLGEDVFQGKVGLVVKVGPSCDFPTVPIALHDWVMIKSSDGLALEILAGNEKIPCRLAMDKYVRVKLSDPQLVW
jgi:hypothetical protein